MPFPHAHGATGSALSAADPVPAGPVMELSQNLKRGSGLGTTACQPTAREQQFLTRVTEKMIDLSADTQLPKPDTMSDAEWSKIQAAEKEAKAAMIPASAYTLAGQGGRYVGWFGIVRSTTWDGQVHRTALQIQHLYFDGLSDLHLQVVSLYGAGDFTAALPGPAPTIPKLGLVRCYGIATKGDNDAVMLAPEYIRVRAWGMFTFMDYGPDKSNPAWVRMRRVIGDNAYSSRPDDQFYRQRLGPPE